MNLPGIALPPRSAWTWRERSADYIIVPVGIFTLSGSDSDHDRDMRPNSTTIHLLALAGFAGSMQLRAIDPMLLSIASEFGVSVKEAALLPAIYTLPFGVMQLVLGVFGDTIGKARVIRISLLCLTVMTAASALAWNFGAALGARALAGAAAGGIVPICFALIGDLVPYDRRQQAIGQIMTFAVSAQVIGAAVSGILVDCVGWRGVIGGWAVVIAASAVLVGILLRSEPASERPLSLKAACLAYRRLLTTGRALVPFSIAFANAMLVLGIFPFIAAIVQGKGLDGAMMAGLAIGAFAVGGVCTATFAGRLVARLGQHRMIWLGALVCGASYLAAALIDAPALFIGLFWVAGIGFYMMHSSLVTITSELDPAFRAAAMAMFMFFFFGGQTAGPILWGAVSTFVSPDGIPMLAGGSLLLVGVAVAGLLRDTLKTGKIPAQAE